MDFQKTAKKAKNAGKNGVRQDEQLLITYSGEERPSESDSDRVKPLELPPTRLRRPKSRKIRVSSANSKSVFSFWNFCQVLFLIVVIGTMVCMVWFTIVLKMSLESMKKRVSILETSDRSTSKECAQRGNDLKKKVAALQKSSAGVVLSDEKHFKSLLHKISVLNRTVGYLKQKLKSHKSVSSIANDLSLLKKAMADTGREMTEVTDKITQLRKIAHLQNSNVKELRVSLYNVSVQIAKLSGQPTPRPVVNTGTPPWLLRVPADSESQLKTKILNAMEAEQLKRNITSLVKKDMSKIIAYVKKANKSALSQIRSLQLKLSALNKNVSKQKALMDKLVKETNHTKNTAVKQNDANPSVDYGVMHQIYNVSTMIHTLASQFGEHDKRFVELVIDVSSMNSTLHQHMYKKEHHAVPSCNCSLDNVWKAMSKDEHIIRSLQSKLDSLKKSMENHKDIPSTTVALPQTTAKRQTTPEDVKPTSPTTTKKTETEATQESTRHTEQVQTSAVPSTTAHKPSTITASSNPTQTNPKPTTATTTAAAHLKNNTMKRDENYDEENGDLNSYPDEDTDNLLPLKDEEIDGDQ